MVDNMTLYLVKEPWTVELDIEGPDEELIEHYVRHLERLKQLSVPPSGFFGQIKDLVSKDTRKYDRCYLFAQAYHIGMVKRGLLPSQTRRTDLDEYIEKQNNEMKKSVRIKENSRNVIISSWGASSFGVLPFKIALGDSESEPYPLDFMLIGPMIKDQAVILGWELSKRALFSTSGGPPSPMVASSPAPPESNPPTPVSPRSQDPVATSRQPVIPEEAKSSPSRTPAQWSIFEKVLGKPLSDWEKLEIKIALVVFVFSFVAMLIYAFQSA